MRHGYALLSVCSLITLTLAAGEACGLATSQVTTPTPQQGVEVWLYVQKLEACRAVGRDADSYRIYEQCEREAGLGGDL